MKKRIWLFITQFATFCFRICLRLRYQIKIEGLEKIPKDAKKCIIAPNHPALIDPVIMVSCLWPRIQFRWIAWKPSMPFFLRWWVDPLTNPLYISDKSDKDEILQTMIKSLKCGNNQLIYPSGMISRNGTEILGKVRGISSLIQEVDDVKIALVRVRGLFGSRFSWGYLNQEPKLWKVLSSGILILLGNLIFFTPRRKVKIEIKVIDKSSFPNLEKETINQFLEDWYNAPGIEERTKTKLFFFSSN